MPCAYAGQAGLCGVWSSARLCADAAVVYGVVQCDGHALAHTCSQTCTTHTPKQCRVLLTPLALQVCCVLPNSYGGFICGPVILSLLRRGHLGIECTQLDRSAVPAGQRQEQQHGEQMAGLRMQWAPTQVEQERGLSPNPVVQAPPQLVQFSSAEVPSSYLQTYKCDVVMAPPPEAVSEAVQHCSATTAAASCGGSSSLYCPPMVPLLPAQHVSLMAAAAAPELVHQRSHQQQPLQDSPAGSSGSMSAEDSAAEADDAIAGLTLWRLRIGLTPAGMQYYAAARADDALTNPVRAGYDACCALASELALTWLWAVPHWLLSCEWQKQQQQDGSRGSTGGGSRRSSGSGSSGFDAAQLYSAVKPYGSEPMLQQQPTELLPLLRPYQRRAAAWMLARECVQQQTQLVLQPQQRQALQSAATDRAGSGTGLICLPQERLHPLWRCALLLPAPAPEAALQDGFAHAAGSSSNLSATAAAAATAGSTASRHSPGLGGGTSRPAGCGNSGAGCANDVLYISPFSGLVSQEAFPAPPVSGGEAMK